MQKKIIPLLQYLGNSFDMDDFKMEKLSHTEHSE